MSDPCGLAEGPCAGQGRGRTENALLPGKAKIGEDKTQVGLLSGGSSRFIGISHALLSHWLLSILLGRVELLTWSGPSPTTNAHKPAGKMPPIHGMA